MNNIINIEEVKPHITIVGLNSVHVVPLSLIEDVAAGKIKLSDVDGANDFIPTLLIEWLKR